MPETRTAGVVFALGLALAAPVPGRAAGPYITARAAVIMDAGTGEVVWERNSTEPLPPASTTKVMTAILALESGRLDESFRVSEYAAETPPSGIHLRAGQHMRLKNLLYAVLLNSANDAAEVVAEGLAGSEEVFAARMTARARELGASTAHFANPHGLTAPGHELSARDLATIFRHGLDVPLFREILETRSDRLLTGYAYQVIGKTGYTRPARRCFVGAASHGDRELIIAVLGARDLWSDARRLFAYGFGEAPPVMMARGATHRRRGLVRHAAAVRPLGSEGDDEATADSRIARYAVRLGPYRSQQVALVTRARLAQRGYRVVLAGRTLRIGAFTNVTKAEQVAGQLRQTGYHPVLVLL
ncbi:MAG: D-alanyl-D-alanine carboxypeptidase [Deltaproteobacteria bacterium]|nr:MAG: D-alanyl-D-alanine carboxypeptidase [Deltaproteobacteria bacterium]